MSEWHEVNSGFNLHCMLLQQEKKDLIHECGVQNHLDAVPVLCGIGMFQKGAFFDQEGNFSLMFAMAKWFLY